MLHPISRQVEYRLVQASRFAFADVLPDEIEEFVTGARHAIELDHRFVGCGAHHGMAGHRSYPSDARCLRVGAQHPVRARLLARGVRGDAAPSGRGQHQRRSVVFGLSATARAQTASRLGDELVSDFKYTANNAAADAIDVATSPLHIGDVPLLTSPGFYLVLGGAGALWGGSYALDQTMKSHLRAMPTSDANLLQNLSYGTVSGATALLYGWGLYSGDARAREFAITAGEGAGTPRKIPISAMVAEPWGAQAPDLSLMKPAAAAPAPQ